MKGLSSHHGVIIVLLAGKGTAETGDERWMLIRLEEMFVILYITLRPHLITMIIVVFG